MDEKIKELLAERAQVGRITCAIAQGIARELGVPDKEVGQTADDMGIRIKDCQLGCF